MNAELFSPFRHLEPYERLLASAERVATQWLLSHFSGLSADTFNPDNLDANKPPTPTRMPNLNDFAEFGTSLRRLIFARTRFIRTVPDTDDLASLRETNLAALKNLGAIQALTEYLLNTYLTQKLNNITELEMKEFSKFTLILPRLAASRHGLVHSHLATLTPNKRPPGSAGILPAHLTDRQKSSKRTSPWERQSPDWRESDSHPSLAPFPSPNPNPSVSNDPTPLFPPYVAQPPSARNSSNPSSASGMPEVFNVNSRGCSAAKPADTCHKISDPLGGRIDASSHNPLPASSTASNGFESPTPMPQPSAKGAPHTSLGQASNASAGPGPDPTNTERQRRVPSDQPSPGNNPESRRDDIIPAPDVSPWDTDPTPSPNPEGMTQHPARRFARQQRRREARAKNRARDG